MRTVSVVLPPTEERVCTALLKRRLIVGVFLGLVVSSVGAQTPIAVRNVTLIDGRTGTARPNMTVVVRGRTIRVVGRSSDVRIPSDAQIIEGQGKWMIPGLIDVHSHTSGRQTLQRALALGVTTTHAMPARPDTTLDLELWSSVPENPAPRVFLTQFLFTAGFPDVLRPGTWAIRTPASVAEARLLVDNVRARGFRHLKLFFDTGKLWFTDRPPAADLPSEIVQAIVDRAHDLRMRVFVHAMEASGARQAISAGVDGMIHPVVDSVMDDQFWTVLHAQRVAWTPTIAVFVNLGDRANYARRALADPRLREAYTTGTLTALQRDTAATSFSTDSLVPAVRPNLARYLETIRRNTRLARDHGVTIAVGSDAVAGWGMHLEMEFMADAGLTPRQILIAATNGSATLLGLQDEIGAIEVGKRADIVVLSEDPLRDVRNLRSTETVIKAGRLFTRANLLQMQ